MPRESRRTAAKEIAGAIRRRPYIARTDYGTRASERDKQIVPFGKYRATIYRRSDVARSSWFLRFFLQEEGRHYRKSLRTTDIEEARERATSELVSILAKVESGQRVLALSVNDLVRRFSLYQESLVDSEQLSPKTLAVQSYRIRLGCAFLKTVYSVGMDTKISAIDGAKFTGYLQWRQQQVAAKREQGTIRRDVVRDELLVIRSSRAKRAYAAKTGRLHLMCIAPSTSKRKTRIRQFPSLVGPAD